MATREAAERAARDMAARKGETYWIHQSNNGQWMFCSDKFYQSPEGRLIIGNRQAVRFDPPARVKYER